MQGSQLTQLFDSVDFKPILNSTSLFTIYFSIILVLIIANKYLGSIEMQTSKSSSSSNIQKHEDLSASAFQNISKALDAEQNEGAKTNLNFVLLLYRKGIKDLKSALALQFADPKER